MKPEKQLVAIHGVPRSGTSWLAQIFRSAPEVMLRFQPLFSYAFKDRLNPSSTREETLRFFHELERTNDNFVLQRDPNIHVDYPEFIEQAGATHLVYKEVRYNHILENLMRQVPELRVIGLVRHPCAVLHSWINAPREFKPEWNVMEQWRIGALKNAGRPEEFYGFEKWVEVAELFLKL
ncbi:MAG TPA: sulfotransferase, partial [Flavobacteriales bacterium]|nr:sulfotransferase [Flavobacteriales bacterium]